VRLILDSPVPMPDQMSPGPRGVARGERVAPNLIDVVPARRLAPHDPPRALDGVGIVDPFASMADPEHGCSAWVMVPRPAGKPVTASTGGVERLASLRPAVVDKPARPDTHRLVRLAGLIQSESPAGPSEDPGPLILRLA
jgi:hypothetical protein